MVETQQVSPISYSEVFDKNFPMYLAMGMTRDEYWNDDCTLTESYRKAYKLKWEDKNRELWLQGEYIYEAILNVSPILHAFAKKGTKPQPYRKEPHNLFPEQDIKVIENQEKNKQTRMLDKMEAFASKFNKSFNKK